MKEGALLSKSGDPYAAVKALNIVRDFETPHGLRRVLHGISFDVRMGERLAILGRNGAGKSTLIKILCGLLPATGGSIIRNLQMSWPLAFTGGFEGDLSGYDNIRFISRLYGRPFLDLYEFTQDFSELGSLIHQPVKTYSDGMRTRLGFALSLGIEFECYLIDEVMSVGDQRFTRKCHFELIEKRFDRAMIVATHDMVWVKEYCSKALVLLAGHAMLFDDVDFACDLYATL